MTECIEWEDVRDSHGYGVYYDPDHGNMRKAHRLSWEIFYGPIPPGIFVCHHCDNPPCVAIDHLFLGTASDNNHDMAQKGRGRNGSVPTKACINGHPWTEENTYVYANGRRQCRTCHRAYERDRREYMRLQIMKLRKK